jgi:hypothetical protein
VTFGAMIVDLGRVVMSVPVSRKRKRLICRFNLKHNWVRRLNPEGEDLHAMQGLRQRTL